jgi:hypothetical protein
MAVIFIGGGNWRKPQICHKSLTNFYHIHDHMPGVPRENLSQVTGTLDKLKKNK